MDDYISRQAVYDALDNIKIPGNASWYPYYQQALTAVSKLTSAQPETNCSEFPNTSDLVSRKAVRDMVATWSYDLAEWEDMELALHDVDELPPAQKHECNNCKHISDDVMTGNRCYKCIFDKIDGWEAKDEDNGS